MIFEWVVIIHLEAVSIFCKQFTSYLGEIQSEGQTGNQRPSYLVLKGRTE